MRKGINKEEKDEEEGVFCSWFCFSRDQLKLKNVVNRKRKVWQISIYKDVVLWSISARFFAPFLQAVIMNGGLFSLSCFVGDRIQVLLISLLCQLS